MSVEEIAKAPEFRSIVADYKDACGTDDELVSALKAGTLEFHEGRIGGAWPQIIR